MRTAVLGGTFDPVHIGHLLMADEVLARCDYERVLFVPNRVPPHKADAPRASAEQRLEMLGLAIRDRPEFGLDTYEIDRNEVSYTIKTLEHLMESGMVSGRPGLVIGEDLVDGFSSWYEADRVEEISDLILVRRHGHGSPPFAREHTVLDNLLLAVSSTDIRERVAQGLPCRYLLHPAVHGYIEEHGLYR
jgi:nicotinate-nucleotide adenylyltransferase